MEELVESLAVMVQKGFEETASKTELLGVEGELGGLKGEVSGLKGEMKEVVKRLDRIEYGMVSHDRRLEILEDKMRIVSVKLGLRR